MNASQLFFDHRKYTQCEPLKKSLKQTESDLSEVPEAPSSFEAPFLSSQRCFSDIQASQLYHPSQRQNETNKCFPGNTEQHKHTYKGRPSPFKDSVSDILASQLYRSTPQRKLSTNLQLHEVENFVNQEANYGENLGNSSQSPYRENSNVFGVNRKPVTCNSVLKLYGDADTGNNNSTEKAAEATLPRKGREKSKDKNRFISPVVPLFPNQRKQSKLEATQSQEQFTNREKETPSKTPLNKNISRNLGLDKDTIPTPMPLVLPSSHGIKLRSIEEIPEGYRSIFEYPYFNIVQSRVFDEVFYTDKPLVVCAPTGAGKTAIFELAIVRLIMKMENHIKRNFKVVYMAPIKALCNEKFNDWKEKFEPYNIKCAELTGDTEMDDYYELQEVNIILTTPEKWDSMTRRWRDNTCFVQSVCLFCIDEIHVLNDATRGATIEAVISRMKTIQAAMGRTSVENFLPKLRFVAVSATIPNIEDVAEWLGDSQPAVSVKLDDSLRPVRLRKVVLGFYFDEQKGSPFHFDMSLNYKLAGIIQTYSENKPTLVFCSTRKSTQQAGETLARDSRGSLIRSAQQRQKLMKYANMVKDNKLRDLVMKGIGFHHAGMDFQDRKYMEEIFASGDLPVLVATSTLAMGVNLPAHLVILKSTQYYNMGCHEEYSDTQILQMIGRAGRPQFDTTATAVIMTKNQTKAKYENLLNGTQVIESSLHRHLVEHLNAEIVLHTINDISIAMEWIRYTFLYIRVMKNPKHYGMPQGLNKEQIEKRLQDLCMKNLNELESTKMIAMDEETFDVKPTEAGRLMARYCIAFATMKKFCNITGEESTSDLITLLADCEEFTEIQLRTNEKRTLNTLNKDKNRATIRYPLQGKIKTKQMKVNVLIQAALGSLAVQDFSLQQDTARIFRAANRISRCLFELLWLRKDFKTLLNAVQLCKSFRAKLWEDSKYVTKQLDGIGPTLSNALVNAGITSFQKIEDTNPRELELIVNRHPPFGNQVRDAVAGLPKYELTFEQVAKYSNSTADLWLHLNIANQEQYRDKKTASSNHTCVLLIGDEDNKIVYQRKIMDAYLMKDNGLTKKLEVKRADKGPDLYINLISQDWVGLDVQSTYTPFYSGPKKISSTVISQQNKTRQETGSTCTSRTNTPYPANGRTNNGQDTGNFQARVPCNHMCLNKRICGHDCCRNGVVPKTNKTPQVTTTEPRKHNPLNNYMSDLKSKLSYFPQTPNMKRLKMSGTAKDIDLNQFAYNPKASAISKSTPMSTTPKQARTYPTENSYGHQPYDQMQPSRDDDCQIVDDWEDPDFDREISQDKYDDEIGEDQLPAIERHPKRRKMCNQQLPLNQQQNLGFLDIQSKGTKDERSSKDYRHTDNPTDMDWPELNMYQKGREQAYEDFDYELPDLDENEHENLGCVEPGTVSFQLQSSLLPYQNNEHETNNRGYYQPRGRPDRFSYDCSPENYPSSAKRPPLTPHRYGQVLAWSNSSKNNSPVTEWSGSDSELMVVDTPQERSDSLFNRDKEIVQKRVEDISSKPWQKRELKQKNANINQPLLEPFSEVEDKQSHYQNSKSLHSVSASKIGTHIENRRPFQPTLMPKNEKRPNVLNKVFNQENQSGQKSQLTVMAQNEKRPSVYGKGLNREYYTRQQLQSTLKANNEKGVFSEGSNKENENRKDLFKPPQSRSRLSCDPVLKISKGSNGKECQKTMNNFFLPKTQTATSNTENPQDTFNSIFDGIF